MLPTNSNAWPIAGETRREALGRFLRERREALAPAQVGISSHRGRRTPGLRREEVAFLADIGVKWYARLEAGDDVHPSAATLIGIADALRLSNAELEYMFDLAGLHQPLLAPADVTAIPTPLVTLVNGLRGVAATLGDRILTPLLWNDLSEAMYGHSRYSNPVERNGLVRSLLDPAFISLLGPDRELLVARAVGMLRLNVSSPSPSPYANDVYDFVKNEALFQRAWKQRIVTNELTDEQITVREHAVVGRLALYAVDLSPTMCGDLMLRVFVPVDPGTARKFERLEKLGSRSPGLRGPAVGSPREEPPRMGEGGFVRFP